MSKDKINSGESEGIFNDYIKQKIKDKIDDIIIKDSFEENISDVIIEIDDIKAPIFTYGNNHGGSGIGIGNNTDKLRFTFPMEKFMELLSQKLELPDLTKLGNGKIKEVSHEFKTFGPFGILLNKKRTFKRSMKTSIALNSYNPEIEKYDLQFRKKDRRYNVPKRVERPKYKAVCFYMGDISFSTFGERLVLEKKIVNFIYNWLNYNYGKNNVEHRFFVHDWDAYEVNSEDFFKIDVAGGTRASVVFDLVNEIARNEYSVGTTNFYAFYFGDGELFGEDAKDIDFIISEKMDDIFNRIGIVEIMPSEYSNLISKIKDRTYKSVRMSKIKNKFELIQTIKKIFGAKENNV